MTYIHQLEEQNEALMRNSAQVEKKLLEACALIKRMYYRYDDGEIQAKKFIDENPQLFPDD